MIIYAWNFIRRRRRTGDPRLMTFLAAEIIKKCEVLAVPARTREQAVSYQIARGLLPELDQKACLSLAVPMTKDRTVLNAAYEQAADLVEEQLKAGKDVACLTLGDPTIYIPIFIFTVS